MNFEEEIKNSPTMSDFCRRIGVSNGGGGFKKAKKIIEEYGLDTSHFDYGGSKRRLNVVVEKVCPVCSKTFETQKSGNRKEKVTCSHSCSNTYFRRGTQNGNWSDDAYRSSCFLYHDKKCIVCDEDKIVEVHHLDGNKKNNKIDNLVPLCPTHHQYWHSRFKYLIEDKIVKYIQEFKISNNETIRNKDLQYE